MAISRMQEPRQLYGLGSLVKSIGKTIKKVVKSPIGKAAIIGLGGAGLMGAGPLGGLLGGAGRGILGSFASQLGPQATSGSGLLGLLGKGKNFLANMSTGTKLGIGGGLLSYLASSGMDQEEIAEIENDPEKLRMYLKDYYSKTNPDATDVEVEEFVRINSATGGRIGFNEGTNMKMASMDENEKELMRLVEEFMERGFSQQEAIEEAKDTLERKSIAIGGRVGLEKGTPKKGLESISLKDMDKFLIKGPHIIKYDEDGNPKKYPRPKGEPHRIQYDEEGNLKKLPERLLLRNKSAMGGLQSMPMGQMRMNKAGTIERDYRETGGFVPVGIKEKADDVPAMLSKNEFVMTADAVRGIGNGNIEKGAQRLYDQMKQAEKRVV
jgi:YD repeat-containing protein